MPFGPAVPHVDEEAEQRPTKQVIVIRRDLRMRRGKEIAQGAHASMAWLRQRVMPHLTPAGPADQVQFYEAERAGSKAACARSPSRWVRKRSCWRSTTRRSRPVWLVQLITDRGLTEFGGIPTRTCLAVGPDYDDLIDPVTGDLELY